MSERLDGQVTLVTGAASGIGRGIARRFVEEGARCLLVDIQDEPGRELARELGKDAVAYVHADVAVEDDVPAAMHLAVERFGRLDCVVNNAGVPLGRPGRPQDIASAALFLSSAEASWVNGAALVVDAGGEVIGDRNGRFVEMDSRLVSEAGRTS
jgi:NAD(P)-dependent dehydrogenase (short-subunit alcohol dehydrogenase family)